MALEQAEGKGQEGEQTGRVRRRGGASFFVGLHHSIYIFNFQIETKQKA